MNEKPLRSESYLQSEEFLRFMPDPKLREIAQAPCGHYLDLVIEEYEDRADYVYVIRHPRLRREDDPIEHRYVLSSEPKEDLSSRTAGQRVKDMEELTQAIEQIGKLH